MWKCEIKKISRIEIIPNANNIELAFAGEWPVVVKKGEWKPGQLCSYIPYDSILPESLLHELNLVDRLSGPAKNRVKPVRLRGQLSVGLVHKAPDGFAEGDAVDTHFGITKYEPPIPIELAGQIVSRPREFAKYDIDNMNDRLRDFVQGEPCQAMLKIHGSNSSIVIDNDGVIKVNSRNYSLAESETNTYWRGMRNANLVSSIKSLPAGTWVYGELVPTQKFRYGHNEPTVYVFDIKDPSGNYWPLSKVIEWCVANNIPYAPIMYEGPFDIKAIEAVATGMEPISGNKIHINEGVVVRPIVERRNHRGERVIAKVINPVYLTGDWDDEKTGG